MLNLSNVLSLSRFGLAFAFLQDNITLRFLAIIAAMITDFLDGFLARRSGTTTQFGAILDPIMDKFFVFFAAGIFYVEGRLTPLNFTALLSRDLSLCLFGLYLWISRSWKDYECKAIFWGKLTTALQFVFLIGLTFQIVFPTPLYFLFVAMAILAFVELFHRQEKSQVEKEK